MRRALLLALAACGPDVTATVVTVRARPAVHGVDSLAVTLGNDNATLAQTFNVHGRDFPLTFSVETPDRTGALTISAQGLDPDGIVAAQGAASATIATNDITDVDLLLEPADFVVNTSVAGAQKLAWDDSAGGLQVAAAPDGTFTIGFTDDCGALGRCDVWGRRFDAGAVAETTEIQSSDQQFNINRSNVFGNDPALATAADGTMLAAWTTFDQILAVTITPTGGAGQAIETVVSSGTSPGQPAVAAMSDGRFVVVWVDSDPNSGLRGLRGRFLDAAAAPSTNPNSNSDAAFNIDTGNGNPDEPAVAASSNGQQIGFAWRDGATLFERFTDSSGRLEQQPPAVVTSDAAGGLWGPKIAPSDNGQFVLAWGHQPSGTDAQIVVRSVSPSGAAIGGDSIVAHGLADSFTAFGLARDGAEYVATWEACGQDGDGSGCGIRARPFRASGVPVGDPTIVDTTTAGDQTTPSIAPLGRGAFVTSWTDDSLAAPDTSDTSVRARVVYPAFDDAAGVLGAACDSAPCGSGLVCTAGSDGARRCYAVCGTCPDGGTCNADGGCAF